MICVLIFGFKETSFHEYKIEGFAQGTTYVVKYYAKRETVNKNSIDSIMRAIDESMSLYLEQSLITKFNRSESGFKMDHHFMKVYNEACRISKETNGLFDATIAPLVQLWGFGPKKIEKLPDEMSIITALNCVGMNKIEKERMFLRKKVPCVKLDFNGIAQGYTVDLIASFLKQRKLKYFMVEVGGELYVNDIKPNGQAFKIAIEGPLNSELNSNGIKHVIEVKRGAVTTSGNYQKYIMNGKQRISHHINPKTGYPLENEMVSVTVYAKDAMTADGYDNALMAMKVEEAIAFVARRRDIEAYMIYTKVNGELADTLSSGFKKMIVN